MTDTIVEAATYKAAAMRLAKDMETLLADRSVPAALRKEVEDVRAMLKRTWADLAADADGDKAEPEPEEEPAEESVIGGGLFNRVMVRMPDGSRVPFLDCVEAYKTRAPEPAREAFFAESLAESDGGAILDVSEATPDMRQQGALALVDFVPIEPGWGNAKDNHHYGMALLKREAAKFVGAKMYATNHVESEKTVRNEVSQIIECPVRYTDSGAPVARAAIYDRDFEYSVRQRAKAGKLEDLHCSIFADGLVKEGFEYDGRSGKDVTAITEVKSVDWVARAGAGGRALALVESAQDVPDKQGAKVMSDKEEPQATEEVVEQDPEVKAEAIAETEEPQALGVSAVLRALLEASLPQPVAMRLAEREYTDEAALMEAIKLATTEVNAILDAAKPKQPASKAFGLQETAKPAPEPDGESREERVRAVLARYNVIRS